jgi:D-alanyl-D-alanine carboxypeptidase (penicillin-binding protein 5/6)
MTTPSHPPDGLSELSELLLYDDHSPDGAARTRARRIRRWVLLVFAILFTAALVAVVGYVGWATTAPLGPPAVTSQAPSVPTTGAAAIVLPTEGSSAISISGGDAYLGAAASGVWAATGTGEPRPIASITKIVTALVILEAKPLAGPDDPGPQITFDKAAHDLYDEYYVQGVTVAEMPTGSSMSLHDALATMLIPSASNYADAVSTWAFGSQTGFLGAARRWLSAHGLTGTTIVDPTGISFRNTSTPSDLLAIGKLAAANPVVAKIAATPSISLPSIGNRPNTNGLLGTHGITGLKTGNLGEGTYNLLYTASLDVGAAEPLDITGVVLGGFSRDEANGSVIGLLDSIRSGFHHVPLAAAGQQVGSFSTPWGATARMVIDQSASIFTWSDTPITIDMQTTTPAAYQDGEVIGSITWTAGPHTATADVVIEGTIDPPTEWWRLTHPGELG